jgi:hypothetical protein
MIPVRVESGTAYVGISQTEVCAYSPHPVRFTATLRNAEPLQWNVYLNKTLRNDLIKENGFDYVEVIAGGVGELQAELVYSDLCAPSQPGTSVFSGEVYVRDQLNGVPCNANFTAFTAAPNPADDQVTVASAAPTGPGQQRVLSFQAQLHDGRGRPVRQQSTSTGSTTFDTRQLPPGLYHLVIQFGQRHTRRLNLQIAR